MGKNGNNFQVFCGKDAGFFDDAITREASNYVLDAIRDLRTSGRVTKRRLSRACGVGEHRMARVLQALELEVELARINSEEAS